MCCLTAEVVDDHVAAAVADVHGHASAHDAESDEAYVHGQLPSVSDGYRLLGCLRGV